MHKYDYSFLKDYEITNKLIGLSNVIFESNNKSNNLRYKNPVIFDKLHEKAVIESTVSSSRIEGIETSEKRQKELLVENREPLNHDEAELSGYKDAIVFISEHYDEIEISEKTIKYLHNLLMYYTANQKGEYKRADNEISIRYEDGSSKTIFETVSHLDTNMHMLDLINAYKDACNDDEINKMLLIPCFIIDFLAIHPFTDGNGRISRLLTLLLLYKEGYDVGKYISYEKMIENYKWNYYEEINKSHQNWHNNKNDYSYYIIFHFQILYRCYKEINQRLDDLYINDKRVNKKKRIENLIFNSVLPISKAEIQDKLPDVSVTTIEKVLSDLLKQNSIKKMGNYKDAKYIWLSTDENS